MYVWYIICIDNIKLDNADATVRFTAWGQIDYMIDIKSIKGLSFQNNWEMINNIKNVYKFMGKGYHNDSLVAESEFSAMITSK